MNKEDLSYHQTRLRLPKNSRKLVDNKAVILHEISGKDEMIGQVFTDNKEEVVVLARGSTTRQHARPVVFLSNDTICDLDWFLINYTRIKDE